MIFPAIGIKVEFDGMQPVVRIANPGGGEVLVTLGEEGPTVTLTNTKGESIQHTWASSQEMSCFSQDLDS